MMRRALHTAFLAGALLAVLAAQANYEAGQQAWDAGRTDEALAEWQAAAGSGDRRAMRALGRAYLQGLGVLQDYVEAHKWFNLAASRGDAEAAAERDSLAEKMTPEQVAKAQALAREWRPSESRVPAASEETTTPGVSPAPELVEETSTPTRELPSDPGADRAATDSPETIETPSPKDVVIEETSIPTRDPAPELIEETSTPTRTFPSDAAQGRHDVDSTDTAQDPSPTASLTEETSTPTRDPVPDADSPPPRTIRPGDVIQDCAHCPQMVVVPAGGFRMGSPDSERGRFSGEGPVHRVTLGESFAVGVYEVTFEEWDACVLDGGCGGYRPPDEGWGRGRRPVINVSWTDARSYAEWLSGKTGEAYRLLSESEWEYVARAGTGTPFHFGKTVSTEQANYDGNHTYGPGRKGPFRRKTVPVGSFSPNRFGLHDVHGNVWEWVRDCRSASFERPPADGSARETGGCSDRMARGGSWNDLPAYLRSAFRNAYQAGVRRSVIGFRVARALRSTGSVHGPKSTQRGGSGTPPGQEAASPDVELTEETSTPTRDLAPDAGRAPPRTDRKGEVFKDCADCPEMVVVTEGEFLMGSPSAEGDRWEDEGPSHWVAIPAPFAVGRYEVTFAEFDACHRDGGCSYAAGDAGWGRGNRPVVHVSWKDAKEYVGWLSEKTGRRYRLLSEAEWEYAARAGTETSYYWGEESGQGHANCSRCGSEWDSKKTSQAGSFDPNGFGLFDMLGNVWEWVEDCGHRNYEGAPSDGSAWVRRGDCRFRMLRGGSWEDPPSRVRSAFRHWESAGTRSDVIGFRVAAPLR